MDLKKIEAIINWQEFKNVKDVRAFIGFANFYRQFINNFSALVSPLIALTQKNKAFIFNKECKKAFACLKVIFITTPILQHFDLKQINIIKTNSLNYVTGDVLSQYNKKRVLYLVIYFLK